MTAFDWCLILVYVLVLTAGFGLAFSGFLRGGFRKHSEAPVRTACGLWLLLFGTASGIITLIVVVSSPHERTTEAKAETTKPEPAQPAKEPVTWKRHVTPDGWCSAELPGKHTEGRSAGLGTEKNFYVATLAAANDVNLFVLVSGDIPLEWMFLIESGPPGLPGWSSRNAEGEVAEQVKSERDVEVDGLQWREFELRDGTLMRFATFDGRLFGMVAKPFLSKKPDSESKRFLDSFRFETPKAKP